MKTGILARVTKNHITDSFKRYAKKTHIMYMGEVRQHSAEYHLVRGFTSSHSHNDTDHCIGTFLHHDFIILNRETSLGRVVIAEVDLHTLNPFSHFFILPNDISPARFAAILKLYPHHRHAPYAPDDAFLPAFKDQYSIFSLPTHFTSSLHFASKEVAKCISAVQSHNYIYEVIDRSLFVYHYVPTDPTEHLLDLQVRFACTLATALETKQ